MSDNQSTDFAGEVGKLRVLMEQTLHEVQAVHELVGAQPTVADFHRLENKVDNLGDRMDVVEAVVKDMSADITELRRQTGQPRPVHFASNVPRPRRD